MVEEESSRVNDGFKVDNCVICKRDFKNDKAAVTGMISFSKEHRHLVLYFHLSECINKKPIGKVLVHKNCRRDYTN